MRQVGLILLLLVPACGGAVNSGPEKAGPVENVKGTIAPLQTLDLTRQTLVYGVEFAQPLAQVWQALLSARETVGWRSRKPMRAPAWRYTGSKGAIASSPARMPPITWIAEWGPPARARPATG